MTAGSWLPCQSGREVYTLLLLRGKRCTERREGGREGGREGRREGGREGGRERGMERRGVKEVSE